ncbi:hypothetical protein B5M09_003400 [Aphanomyces astaci]|uniref:Uncharacterized protein n=1 Tax=Aphanomyces astaci TaxID=112090 RepID=A0A3R7WHY2_APHAT|nr:hypothetical protein B5M09_003400 [Aphanomyces astaci]
MCSGSWPKQRLLLVATATSMTRSRRRACCCSCLPCSCLICLEMFVRFMEHATTRKTKYADMLHKTTQELMIVGLIYLLVKLNDSDSAPGGQADAVGCAADSDSDQRLANEPPCLVTKMQMTSTTHEPFAA